MNQGGWSGNGRRLGSAGLECADGAIIMAFQTVVVMVESLHCQDGHEEGQNN